MIGSCNGCGGLGGVSLLERWWSDLKSAWNIYGPGVEQVPLITPPDLSPVAPQVGYWSPETMELYTGERRARDVDMAQKAEVDYGDATAMKPLPWWLVPSLVGVGALLILRR